MKKLLCLTLFLLLASVSGAKCATWFEWLKQYPEANRGEFTLTTKIAAGVGLAVLGFYHIKAYCDRKKGRNRTSLDTYFDDQQLSLSDNYITRRGKRMLEEANKVEKAYLKTAYWGLGVGIVSAIITKTALVSIEKLYSMVSS